MDDDERSSSLMERPLTQAEQQPPERERLHVVRNDLGRVETGPDPTRAQRTLSQIVPFAEGSRRSRGGTELAHCVDVVASDRRRVAAHAGRGLPYGLGVRPVRHSAQREPASLAHMSGEEVRVSAEG
jgi:hypothetical protein